MKAFLVTVICVLYMALIFAPNEKVEVELPFDPRLCENTGIPHKQRVVNELGYMVDIVYPKLDCTNYFLINKGEATFEVSNENINQVDN